MITKHCVSASCDNDAIPGSIYYPYCSTLCRNIEDRHDDREYEREDDEDE